MFHPLHNFSVHYHLYHIVVPSPNNSDLVAFAIHKTLEPLLYFHPEEYLKTLSTSVFGGAAVLFFPAVDRPRSRHTNLVGAVGCTNKCMQCWRHDFGVRDYNVWYAWDTLCIHANDGWEIIVTVDEAYMNQDR